MTASILLFNQKAAVVASDTLAVSQGPDGDTSWPSATKIFEVPGHPVVILGGGSVTIAGIRLDLLIDEWIAQIESPFDTLEEYAASFLDCAGDTLLEFEVTDHNTVHRVISDELDDFAKYSGMARFVRSADHTDAEIDEALCRELAEYSNDLADIEQFEDLDVDRAAAILDHLGLDLARSLGDALKRPDLSFGKGVARELVTLATLVLSRYVPCARITTHLNFVGYGQTDLTPGQVPVQVRGFWDMRLRSLTFARRPEAMSQAASWDTQAQTDAMDGFLMGMDHQLVDDLIDLATAKLAQGGPVTESKVSAFADALRGDLRSLLTERFADRFGAVLWSLSVPGMVRAADSLIKLQELRAATRGGPAQVGGTVEVVSIERHSGVTWHHRLPMSPLTADVSIHPLA